MPSHPDRVRRSYQPVSYDDAKEALIDKLMGLESESPNDPFSIFIGESVVSLADVIKTIRTHGHR